MVILLGSNMQNEVNMTPDQMSRVRDVISELTLFQSSIPEGSSVSKGINFLTQIRRTDPVRINPTPNKEDNPNSSPNQQNQRGQPQPRQPPLQPQRPPSEKN